MKTIQIATRSHVEFVDVTSHVKGFVAESKVRDGVCWAFIPHTTAGLTINEGADPSVRQDIVNHLAKLVPQSAAFSHEEGNSPSHIKASLMGSSLSVFVSEGQLVLGTWQAIYLCEFDGPRTRKLLLKITEK
jgi:secondary thiamine-phosphate synthase enzyme